MSDHLPTHLELLARLAAVEARLAAIETLVVPYPLLYGAGRRDCNCPPNAVCMNVACPRQVKVNCASTGGT